ncbi:MAG: ankyrin repeat domain-containing protein [Candidatus Angelobacter sp.]
MLHLLLTAAMLVVPVQQPASHQDQPPAPIQVSRKEADQHTIGDGDRWFYLRVPQNQWSFFSSIRVTVVVDTTGAIISSVPQIASTDGSHRIPSSVLSQAEAMVRTLHFKPFERAGHPVSVTFNRDVGLLPLELKPAQRVPFPKVKDWKTVKITLARTGCFGTCPSYKVEVHGDGTVFYEGRGYVTFTGTHRGLVPQSNVIELVKLFEKADYYSLRDEYRSEVTDNPTQTTSISIDGRQKQVVDYVGLSAGMPLAVEQLELAIDRLSGSDRWTRGNSETVAALEAEHWDFKSHEAAATLARAAEYGNADVVRDLALAGVPLNGISDSRRFALLNGGALERAASRGDVAMLRALLQAGAASSPRALAAALVNAANSGNVEALRLLLANGASITARNAVGATALMTAASSGYSEMVREVLKEMARNHADVNASATPPPPSCTEEMKKNDHCRDFAEGDGRTALMAAVFMSDYDAPPEGVDRVEVVRLLLAAGADVNARDRQGDTVLMLCRDDVEQVELLLKAGADPNARNLEGETALSKAYDDEVKQILIKYGAVPLAKAAEQE